MAAQRVEGLSSLAGKRSEGNLWKRIDALRGSVGGSGRVAQASGLRRVASASRRLALHHRGAPAICPCRSSVPRGFLKILQRINELIRDALRNPFSGIGKPEPLRNNLKGWWSRRITQEHRLIYRVEADSLLIMQCRFPYDD